MSRSIDQMQKQLDNARDIATTSIGLLYHADQDADQLAEARKVEAVAVALLYVGDSIRAAADTIAGHSYGIRALRGPKQEEPF